MNHDDLETRLDAELEALFAREVAQLGTVESHWGDGEGNAIFQWKPLPDPRPSYDQSWSRIPKYCADANVVLPCLETAGWSGVGNRCGSTCASTVDVLIDGGPATAIGQADYERTQTPFARAGVIALLRSKRAQA